MNGQDRLGDLGRARLRVRLVNAFRCLNVGIDHQMCDVHAEGPHFARKDLCNGALSKLTHRQVEVAGASNNR